jgi:hypothetical protein
MDDLSQAYLQEQLEARRHDDLSASPAAFARHMARIRQHPDGHFQQRAPDGTWYHYIPGGYPYHGREIEELRVRGYAVTDTNVRERPRNEGANDREA